MPKSASVVSCEFLEKSGRAMQPALRLASRVRAMDLPGDVRDLRAQDLRDLIADKNALAGLRDSLQSSVATRNDYKERAVANKARLARLDEELQAIDNLERELKELSAEQTRCLEQWHAAESQMYAISRPYTSVGIEHTIREKVASYKREAEALEKRLVAETDVGPALAKQFAEALKNKYYYEDMLRDRTL